jgi:peptidoglycan DL-endopeptidase CwlO
MRARILSRKIAIVFLFGLSITTYHELGMAARAEANVASDYKGFPEGYCTYYAAKQFDSVAPSPKTNWHGNAGDWLNNAGRAGWATSINPRDAKTGALIVWQNGDFGHVGVVTGADRNNVYVSEMNWGKIVDKANAKTENFNKVTSISLPFSNLSRRPNYSFAGYIFPQRFVGPRRP